jgi:hypothetical protein
MDKNDNRIEVDGFINVAKKINADAIISRDWAKVNKHMSEREYGLLLYFVNRCKQENVSYLLQINILSADLQRLKADGLLAHRKVYWKKSEIQDEMEQ